MAKPFQPTPHPVLGLPTPAQALALGELKWRDLMVQREQIIRNEKADPYRNSWEPPIWKVCDALLGFPWVDADWAERMRQHLGFKRPVNILLILGGQRGGKSEYAATRVMRVLRSLREQGKQIPRAWALHSNLAMSVDYQQPLIYKYLPPELKGKSIKSDTTYIAWKQKTGFSDEKIVLPPDRPGQPGPDLLFKTYDQDIGTIEGGNLNIIWPDELVPADWVQTMELRISEQEGWMIITFTPVEGYTETVRSMCDGAEVCKESTAFLCPKDGGPEDLPRALGLTPEQVDELHAAAAAKPKRAALHPQSIPENCDAWLCEPHLPNGQTSQPAIPAGREFEKVPRVLKCADPEEKRAVVYFHTSDNPFGNPKNVWGMIAKRSGDFIKERFYGIAHKTIAARFTKFNRHVHVINPDQVPAEGTNYQCVDPAGRNFFMHWYRVTPRNVYLYREWPGPYGIPEVGFPGPWALPGPHPDGRRGPAQKPFGWGHLNYKEEIARLERWHDSLKPNPEAMEKRDWIMSWDEHNGSHETIQQRFIDSRYASTPKMDNDRPVTLITEFEDVGVFFSPTPGDDINEGVQLIQNALDYNTQKPVDYFNQPRLLVSTECTNTIFALMTWTGLTKEGRRCLDGATKDPIDLLRYFFMSDCQFLGGKADEDEDEKESEFEAPSRRYY